MNKEPYRRPDLIDLDPNKREWMYDGAGNKVYKNNYTNAWHTPNWFKMDKRSKSCKDEEK